MRYLIDTNIIVYIISDPDSLDNDVKAIIADPDNILYTSAESAKELVPNLQRSWSSHTETKAY